MNKASFTSRFKFGTFLALVTIYLAVIFEWTWMWGIFLLFWVIPDLISGSTRLVQSIHRSEHPIWYWLIVSSWLWMAVYLIVGPFVGWTY